MVETDGISIPVTADEKEFERTIRKVEQRQERFEKDAEKRSQRGGRKRGAFLGGAVGGFVGAAVSRTPVGDVLGQTVGQILTILLLPLIVALAPLIPKMLDAAISLSKGTTQLIDAIERFPDLLQRDFEALEDKLGGPTQRGVEKLSQPRGLLRLLLPDRAVPPPPGAQQPFAEDRPLVEESIPGGNSDRVGAELRNREFSPDRTGDTIQDPDFVYNQSGTQRRNATNPSGGTFG